MLSIIYELPYYILAIFWITNIITWGSIEFILLNTNQFNIKNIFNTTKINIFYVVKNTINVKMFLYKKFIKILL